MNKQQEMYIVCAPADAPLAVKGTTFDQHCAFCNARLMLAPTGQQRLRREPSSRLVCYGCYQTRLKDQPHERQFAASSEEMRAEQATAGPNLYRNRN